MTSTNKTGRKAPSPPSIGRRAWCAPPCKACPPRNSCWAWATTATTGTWKTKPRTRRSPIKAPSPLRTQTAGQTASVQNIEFDPANSLNATFNYSDAAGDAHEVWMLDAASAYNDWKLLNPRPFARRRAVVAGPRRPVGVGFLAQNCRLRPPRHSCGNGACAFPLRGRLYRAGRHPDGRLGAARGRARL